MKNKLKNEIDNLINIIIRCVRDWANSKFVTMIKYQELENKVNKLAEKIEDLTDNSQ